MNKLFFDKFDQDLSLVLPYEAIGDGVCLSYDKNIVKNGVMASLRVMDDVFKTPYMIIDAINFCDHWFGIEIELPSVFKAVEVIVKAYPATQLYPRIYYDNGEMPTKSLSVSENPDMLRFTRNHLISMGFPEDAKNSRLVFFSPVSEWFVIGLYSVRITHG